ncbi:hypothetical protein MGYG_09176 [Nannizzia gypsea CBS 118893]|uniref:Uncharacterized protein n=1 Tax=Arthroderma gypseum (strain ATCC MYA-4604 / CBS 118893) TaxID=535722 RepID=E4V4F0_ARTGP|nr:hypothetical protein MGYG_09176 [Nannizzia gypsea CBS 118893]EFR04874.1 hypothetical protein MGYG_09176 [Nannizzia gypsea CBS 118893]
MNSFIADRKSMVVGLKRVLGQPPLKWYNASGSNDDDKLLAFDGYEFEEKFSVEEYEKLPPEFTETDLMSLTEILSGPLGYEPQGRGTPAELFLA